MNVMQQLPCCVCAMDNGPIVALRSAQVVLLPATTTYGAQCLSAAQSKVVTTGPPTTVPMALNVRMGTTHISWCAPDHDLHGHRHCHLRRQPRLRQKNGILPRWASHGAIMARLHERMSAAGLLPLCVLNLVHGRVAVRSGARVARATVGAQCLSAALSKVRMAIGRHITSRMGPNALAVIRTISSCVQASHHRCLPQALLLP